ncbi:hypothetical protein HNP46_000299 [Pseudomonas nitritireducens]|uniref:Uncharacterized protein n=1 Tax=Pseudomonas nitroreducens TaxID=46680 RepID=A0A7W7NYA4_PSENT|nr:hypothetical protein [Pseudomonas nitritireducens]MBB4861488.1 hypothetical protein [Pseudomonas nitritireducens]
MPEQRDPRVNPHLNDELKDSSGRHVVVTAVYALKGGRGNEVCFQEIAGGEAGALGLTTWRKAFKRAEVIKVAEL